MKLAIKLALLTTLFTLPVMAQNWSTFLDPSRAVDWTSAGFTIPSYSVNCATQPSLTAGSGAASTNSTSIQNALNSCDSTHNVVNIPAGTWYVTKVSFGTQGKQVLRGAGPNSTTVIFTTGVGCTGGLSTGFCMKDSVGWYNGSGAVLPGGSNACSWSGPTGYSQGSTTLTLTSCGSSPPNGQTIILDQADDTSDTGGVYICDTNTNNCGYESNTGGNNNGRSIGGKTYSQQQVTQVTGVAANGGGNYTVTVSPGVYFSNIRASQNPGAWWPGFVANDGVENMTVDGSALSGGATIGMYDCYECWVKNVRSKNAGRNHVDLYQSADDVIRDSYFFGAQGSASESYAIEFDEASSSLVENNIFQQVTTPIMFGAGTGNVIGYNFNVNVNYSCGGGCSQYGNGAYFSHNAGNEMNLFEGNNFYGIWGDDAWGSSGQSTYFRNMLTGWQSGKTASTFPILLRAYIRNLNIVGNVMGQPGYSTQYQAIATSTSSGTGAGAEDKSIYSIGWAGTGATCSSGFITQCDPKSGTTLMRWGNYDTVTAAPKWDSTEAAPIANTYVGANFSTGYFGGLAHTLPASLYYNSTPLWWPGGKNFPAIGPDVSTGNVGTCSGTYAGAQATLNGQCTGGVLSTGWASHTTSIPAQDCFLVTMGGVPNGTGTVLNFDANTCYSASPAQVATPTFSPVAGSYGSPQTVTISTTTPGATLYYTLDGSTPTYAATSPTIFGILSTSTSLDPTPFPPIVRGCCGQTPNNIVQSRGNYTNFGPLDSWVNHAKSKGSEFLYTFTYTPTWASTNGTLAAPYDDIAVTAACQNILAGTTTTDCKFKEIVTAYMQHYCHVTSQPATPIVGGCDIKYWEPRNEANVGIYWLGGTPTQLATMSMDMAHIIRLYCGDCKVYAGSTSAGGAGTNGQFNTYTQSWLAAWTHDFPDGISYHPYGANNTVIPSPFPTTTVSHSSSLCTPAGGANPAPNSKCNTPVMNQAGLLKTMLCTTFSSWGCPGGVPLEIIGTEGGVGKTAQMTDGIDGSDANSWFLRKAWNTQWMLTQQANGVKFTLYYNLQDQCWMPMFGINNNAGCTSDPLIPNGNTPIQPAFVTVQGWLQRTTNMPTVPTATPVAGGNIWKMDVTYNGLPAQYAWYDGWLTSTNYTVPAGMLYVQSLTGTNVPAGTTVTLTQQPILLTSGATFTYSGPVSIPNTLTLKALGAKSGFTDSTVASGLYTIAPGTAVAPTFNPVAGTYLSPQSVTLSSTTPGVTICYTVDGTLPTATTPGSCSHGTTYSAPVSVPSSLTIQALATESGWINSSVSSAAYTITLTTAAPDFSPAPSTYTSPQTVTISTTTPSAVLCYTINGTTPTAGTPGTCDQLTYSTPLSIGTTTTLKSLTTRSGWLNSPVTSGVYTINIPVVATPTFTPVAGTYNGAQVITISTSTSGAALCYTTDGSTPASVVGGFCSAGTTYTGPITVAASATVKALGTKNSFTNSSVGSAAYVINPNITADPSFSPVAGTYVGTQTVSISTATAGATICYTIDGSTPAASSPGTCSAGLTYSSALTVSVTTTIKALATKASNTNSGVVSGLFTINGVADPTFSPPAGTYSGTQSVTISSTTPSATICFTVDGTTPTATAGACTHGTTYTVPVSVATTETVKALAALNGAVDSAVISAAYSITLATPSFSPVPGTYTSIQTVTISSLSGGATICYSIDGSTPTATTPGTCDGLTYTTPLTISTTTTVKALATQASFTNSAVFFGTYTINLPSAQPPIYSPPAGAYGAPQTVIVTSTTSGSTICYTTDGSAPTATAGSCTHGTTYTVPIYIGGTTTLKALASKVGFNNSSATSGTYTISIPPVITSGTWYFKGNVKIIIVE